MVKIVKPESKQKSYFRGVCLRCRTNLQWTSEDIESYGDENSYIHFLLCPVCEMYQDMKVLGGLNIVEGD